MALHEIAPADMRVGSLYKLRRRDTDDSRLVKVLAIEREGTFRNVSVSEVTASGELSRQSFRLLFDTKLKPDPEWKVISNADETAGEVSGKEILDRADRKSSSSGTKAIAITLGVLAVKIGLLVAFINSQTK